MSSNRHMVILTSLVPLYAALAHAENELSIWQNYSSDGNECGQGCCGYTSEEVISNREYYANQVDDNRNKILDILKGIG